MYSEHDSSHKGPTGDPTKDYTMYESERVIRKEAAMLANHSYNFGTLW